MYYKASWKSTFGFKYIFIFLFVLFIGSGFLLREFLLLLIGLILLLYFVILPIRQYVELDKNKLLYQKWFTKIEVPIKEIISITNSRELKYPKNKIYGPNTFKICTKNKCFMLNTIYYNSDFNNKILLIKKSIHK